MGGLPFPAPLKKLASPWFFPYQVHSFFPAFLWVVLGWGCGIEDTFCVVTLTLNVDLVRSTHAV